MQAPRRRTFTPWPLAPLGESELASVRSKLPVVMDAWGVDRKKFWRNLPKPYVQRFIEKVVVHKPTGCWIWMSALTPTGYGRFTLFGVKLSAHRAAWMIFNGTDPGLAQVCHSCDTPRCVNPDHLFLGTCLENTHDCIAKGRRRYLTGEMRYNAKLAGSDVVIAWVCRHAFSMTCAEIAGLLGVTKSSIQNIFYSKLHWATVKYRLTKTDGWEAMLKLKLPSDSQNTHRVPTVPIHPIETVH